MRDFNLRAATEEWHSACHSKNGGVKRMRNTRNVTRSAEVMRGRKQMHQPDSRAAHTLRRSAIQQLRNSIALQQRQVQNAADASALSVARTILEFMEDLPKLQRDHLDCGVLVSSR
jgi:hypothetical protein